LFQQYVPVAATSNGSSVSVCGVVPAITAAGPICPAGSALSIPVGAIAPPSPSYQNNTNWITNIDFTQSERTQHRGRFIFNNNDTIDTGSQLPQFFVLTPVNNRLFSYTLTHTFSAKLTNETRLAYRRSVENFPVPDGLSYPGLDTFPNIGIGELGSLNIGPNGNFPQFGFENNYQFVNNTTYLVGNHSLKFGVDFRNVISPQSFVQRSRGDYQYSTLELFLRDLTPDNGAQRTVGGSPYYGNQQLFYPFVQDDWRIRRNITLNLGLNYSYQSVPTGTRLQALNALSSVPGFLEFREPKAQKTNFAPKIGIAWSPNFSSSILGRLFGTEGQSSIRAGFSMGYDYIFDNLYILSLPPQANQTVNADITSFAPNFLANGGIPNTPVTGITDPAAARLATSGYIADQKVPYAVTYTLSLQRQFQKDWSLELRYLGTRGVHLLTQNQINVQPGVSPQLGGLPTFLSAPSQAQLDALSLNLDQISTRSNVVPAYDAAGFNGSPITTYLSNGNSEYHAFSAQLNRRFAAGFQATAAYTWSHLIDDTTAEVFSTVLSPRRVQDFQNLAAEKADSALDRRHRFVFSGLYELPFFKTGSRLKRSLLGGFNLSGTLSFESGQKATVLSGIDSNLNGDSAPDRTIINPNGVTGTSSTVSPLTNSAGQVVAYLANNPNAQYIQAGLGAVATSGRNTLQLPGINNFDFSLYKNFAVTEAKKLQFRVDLFNAFNHPQYIPGSPNSVIPVDNTGVSSVNTVGRAQFNQPDQIFTSKARIVQMALKLSF
jgi:hypothetical protein